MKLTGRQKEILQLIDEGLLSEEIAETLGLSRWTIRDHVRRLSQLLGTTYIGDLPDAARARGIAF